MSKLIFDEFDGGGVIGLGQEVELVEGDDFGFGGELGEWPASSRRMVW